MAHLSHTVLGDFFPPPPEPKYEFDELLRIIAAVGWPIDADFDTLARGINAAASLPGWYLFRYMQSIGAYDAMRNVTHYLYWESAISASELYETLRIVKAVPDLSPSESGYLADTTIVDYAGPLEIPSLCTRCFKPAWVHSRQEKNAIEAGKRKAFCRRCGAWSGYVYLIKSGDVHKIGMTVEVNRRIEQISPVMPYPIELIHIIRTNNHQALERRLHEMFGAKRLNGEWFQLDEVDIGIIQSLSDLKL